MPTFSDAFLQRDGQEIVDAQGNPVMLRGYGLGGWLVPEGYMLHIPGFGSPTSIRNMIEDVVGPSNTDIFYAEYEANYVNENDIAKIAEWGFNSIRLPFHYKNFYDPENEVFVEAGFDMLDEFLNWCDTYDLIVILDMHCAPGGQNDGNISDSDGVARLWTEPDVYQPMTIAIWTEIATRYATDERIGGYDLINEPVLPDGYSNQVLRDFYVDLTNAIRQVDTNHLLFIEGNWYATDFNLLTPPWDDNMAYSFHKYWNSTDLGSIQYLLSIRSQHNVPLWLGETGENSNPWFYETVQLMEDQNIGWCWWAHKKLETITSPLSATINAGYQGLLDYWNGQGTQPTPEVAMNALMQMAENLKLENCQTRHGVIRALTDPNFGTQPVPFTELTVPGVINAVHYDMGTQGVGYIDTDFKNEAGSGGATWNTGWQYRNDGVDIEESSDSQGHPYNVGWFESGERLMYTINVADGGLYEIHFRVASANGGGAMQLFLDGEVVAQGISVPGTNGWQNWETVTATDVVLPAGTHKLTIMALPGGFNLNRMTFFYTGVGIESPQTEALEFSLDQNYPNPFNPVTTLQFSLGQDADVALAIYTVTGQKIATLVDKRLESGTHTVFWRGETDAGSAVSSGTYLARLQAGEHQQMIKVTVLK